MKRLALLTLVMWGLVACTGGVAVAPNPSLTTLRLSHDLWPGYFPVYIARAQGYFAEEGLDVQATSTSDTDSLLAGLAAGRFEAVAVSLGDTIILNQTSGQVRVVAVTDMSLGGDAFLVQAGLSGEALRGKRIGVNQGGFAELFVREVLVRHGLTFADVTIVDTDASALPAALRAGQVEAGHTWEPFITEAVNDGAQVLFSSADTPGLIPDVLVFRDDVLTKNPAAVRGFLRAWFRAVDFWRVNPTAGNALIAAQTGLPAETISLAGIQLLGAAENRQLFMPGSSYESLHYTARVYTDFFAEAGYITTRPEVSQLLAGEFLP